MSKTNICQSLRRAIRREQRGIRWRERRILTLERNRVRALRRWENALRIVDQKIDQIRGELTRRRGTELSTVNNFYDNKIKSVTDFIKPQIDNLNKICSERDEAFNDALAPLLTKLSSNQSFLSRLKGLRDQAPDWASKFNYNYQIKSQEAVIRDIESNIAAGRGTHAERQAGCNSNVSTNPVFIQNQGVQYWEVERTKAVAFVNNKWNRSGAPQLISDWENRRAYIQDNITRINTNYDNAIDVQKMGIQFSEQNIRNYNDALFRNKC